jgi:hypothetical protein
MEAADNALPAPELANGITRVNVRLENWLTTGGGPYMQQRAASSRIVDLIGKYGVCAR